MDFLDEVMEESIFLQADGQLTNTCPEEQLETTIPSNYGAPEKVLSKNLTCSLIRYRIPNDPDRCYIFRQRKPRTEVGTKIKSYWICLGCEKLRVKQHIDGAACNLGIEHVGYDETMTSNPLEGHHERCVPKSIVETEVTQLKREANVEVRRGVKKPMQAYKDTLVELTQRLSGQQQVEVAVKFPAYKHVKTSLFRNARRNKPKGIVPSCSTEKIARVTNRATTTTKPTEQTTSRRTRMVNQELIIIDTDCGTDDAAAILLALNSENVQVLGITCIGGNTSLGQVCSNVLRVLKIAHKEDIPVFRGCGTTVLSETFKSETRAHSADGLGGIASTIPIDESRIQAEHAVNWMARTVAEHSGKVTLITLGPLTNAAVAHTMYPEFNKHLKQLYIMGGTLDDFQWDSVLIARGNVSLTSEFNVFCDPEAAHVVIKDFACPMTIISWDTCLDSYLPIEWYQQKVLASNSVKANFLARMFRNKMEWQKTEPSVFKGFFACDLIAMACLVEPKVVVDYIQRYATVELTGTNTRGQLVVDWRDFMKKQPNLNIVKKIDVTRLQTLFEARLLR